MYSAVEPTAKSLVLDLLSTLRRGTMPVGAVLEAAALFGIAENSVRVALTRLTASGQVERDRRGRYRMGAAARPIMRWATSWREIERRIRRWDGAWNGVLEGPRGGGRGERRQRERALRFLGFRPLTPQLAVRPDNLRGGVATLRDELSALGLPPGQLVVQLRDLDAPSEARARSLWDATRLRDEHRALAREIERDIDRLKELPAGQAMVRSFLLGGRAIRQLVLDPLLPDAIAPGDERRELLAALRRYDPLGRDVWAAFMTRHGVPRRRGFAPADTRMAAGAERLRL